MAGGGLSGIDLNLGMAKAVFQRGRPDLICGTSAGAIVGAFVASRSIADCEQMVRGLKDSDVLDKRWFRRLRSPFLGHTIGNEKILQLFRDHLPEDFGQLRIPLRAMATDLATGRGRWMRKGCLRSAVLASSAISGIFPHVRIGKQLLADGGTAHNIPLPEDWHHFDEIYICIPGAPYKYDPEKANVIERLLWNIDLLMRDQTNDILRVLDSVIVRPGQTANFKTKAYVIQPPMGGEMLSFKHSLIEPAAHFTDRFLAARGNFARGAKQ